MSSPNDGDMFNSLTRALVAHGLKQLTQMRHPSGSSFLVSLLSRTKYDYRRDVGDGTGSSVIMGPVQFIQRTLPEAPLKILRGDGDEQEFIDGHPLEMIIKNPNPFYGGLDLWAGTILSWCISGNAYWLVIRNARDVPIQLWWVPETAIKPKWDEIKTTEFITHYEYTPGRGQKVDLEPRDVVHFRHGIDPKNIRLGLSPLHSVMREVWVDDEASNMIGALLRNGGIPGVVISPKAEEVLQADAEMIKDYVKENFTGDRRGEPFVSNLPVDVKQYGWSPAQLGVSAVRNVSEERVCALLGIPSAAVGFGTGMEQTKVGATMKELIRLAWDNGIIPIQAQFADEIDRSLLPEFGNSQGLKVAFDRRNIHALREDKTDQFTRANIGVSGGWMTVAAGKRMVGVEPEPGDDIYLRGLATVEVPAGGSKEAGSTREFKADEFEGEDPAVRRAISNGDRPRRTRLAMRMIAALELLAEKLIRAGEPLFEEWYDEIGGEVARAAEEVLAEKALSPEDEVIIEKIIDLTRFDDLIASGKKRYMAHFNMVAVETFKTLDGQLGLFTDLPDIAARRILEAGGKKVGLRDLTDKTKNKLFKILSVSREEGLGVDAIKRRIRDTVGAGTFSDNNIRARVVARTETKFAQNISSLEYSKETGARRMMVFDDRIGYSAENPAHQECAAIDGAVVSVDEVEALAAAEHPNGTRGFIPWHEDGED